MNIKSIPYYFFIIACFIIYWIILGKKKKLQNLFLLIASYFFYSCWDFRFAIILFLSSLFNYLIALSININQKNSKFFLYFTLTVNILVLAFFKYWNFFIESWIDLWSSFNIILPLGISFYTFHNLSYLIDVYKKKIKPCTNPIVFFNYISFFPKLIAGPIEKASDLIPQFQNDRYFNKNSAIEAVHRILWGLVKKIVIADTISTITNEIFANYAFASSTALITGAIAYSIQLYCDFSGYSDIAIGIAKLLGFNLTNNFKYPYFSRDIAEFWKRWHISLTNWFRQYLYYPLGGSRVSFKQTLRNVFVIFIISGVWHGAGWNYILWGFLHFVYYLPTLFGERDKKNLQIVAKGKIFPSIKEVIFILSTFFWTTVGWIFFRSGNLTNGILYIYQIFKSPADLIPKYRYIYGYLICFIVIEWLGREKEYPIELNKNAAFWKKILLSWILLTLLTLFGKFNQSEFIYFQF